MPIVNEIEWKEWEDANDDEYGKCCVDVAREVMRLLDECPGDFDVRKLINKADDNIKAGGITGFMASCVAQMVSVCHSRGEEFRQKWNKAHGSDIKGGVINPAILTIEL